MLVTLLKTNKQTAIQCTKPPVILSQYYSFNHSDSLIQTYIGVNPGVDISPQYLTMGMVYCITPPPPLQCFDFDCVWDKNGLYTVKNPVTDQW